MRVKIGHKIYDSNEEPILLILSDEDKENIAKMIPGAHKFCSYPDHLVASEIIKWMNDAEDKTASRGDHPQDRST
jgi:hypothetical protein